MVVSALAKSPLDITYTEGTALTGTLTATNDSSGNLTGITLKGDILPAVAGTAKESVDITFATTSTGVTLSGSVSKGDLALAIGSGSGFTVDASTQSMTGMNLLISETTAKFKHEGTLTLGSFASDKSGLIYAPTSISFSGKTSDVGSAGTAEFFNGSIKLSLTGYANFNVSLPDSGSNFVTSKLEIAGTVTKDAKPAQLTLTLIDNDTTFQNQTLTLAYTKSGASVINGSASFLTTAPAKTLTITGSNGIKVELTQSESAGTSGLVKEGTTTIGTIENGSNKVNFTDGTYVSIM